MIMKSVKQDLQYTLLSNRLIYLVLIVSAIISFMLYFNFQAAQNANGNVNREVGFLERDGFDVLEELEKEYTYQVRPDGGLSIENFLSYSVARAEEAIFAVSPSYAPFALMEMSLGIFPILFIISSFLLINADNKSKMVKIKSVRQSRLNTAISQLITNGIINAIIITAYFVIGFIVSLVFHFMLQGELEFAFYDFSRLEITASPIMGILFVLFISLFFSAIGMLLTTIFRNIYAPLAFIALFLLAPTLTPYDPRNLMGVLNASIFDHLSFVFPIYQEQSLGNGVIVLIFALATVAMFVANIYIASKKSAYLI